MSTLEAAHWSQEGLRVTQLDSRLEIEIEGTRVSAELEDAEASKEMRSKLSVFEPHCWQILKATRGHCIVRTNR